jgi:uncharacterized protein involved in tolerance to divalent cations
MTNYAIKIIKKILQPNVLSVTVTKDAFTNYNSWLRKSLDSLIWNKDGPSGWYCDVNGWNPNIFPHFQSVFWWQNLYVEWSDFNVELNSDENN